MRIKTLRNRIEIWAWVDGQANEYNETAQSRTLVARLWAGIEAVSARELEVARSMAPTVSHVVTTRYRTGITTAHHFTLGNRTFAINGVTEPATGLRTELKIYATEITS